MTRFPVRPVCGALAAIVLSSATLLGPFAATPAFAAQGTGYFRAELASPLAQPRQEILSGVVWKCEGTSCTGSKSGSRAVIVCGRLASKLGPVASFADPRGELGEDDLRRCNKG